MENETECTQEHQDDYDDEITNMIRERELEGDGDLSPARQIGVAIRGHGTAKPSRSTKGV